MIDRCDPSARLKPADNAARSLFGFEEPFAEPTFGNCAESVARAIPHNGEGADVLAIETLVVKNVNRQLDVAER